MVTSLVQYDKNTLDPIGRFMSKRSRMAPPTAKEYKELFERMDKAPDYFTQMNGGKTDVYKMLTSMQKFERPVALKATGRSNFCIEVGDVEEC